MDPREGGSLTVAGISPSINEIGGGRGRVGPLPDRTVVKEGGTPWPTARKAGEPLQERLTGLHGVPVIAKPSPGHAVPENATTGPSINSTQENPFISPVQAAVKVGVWDDFLKNTHVTSNKDVRVIGNNGWPVSRFIRQLGRGLDLEYQGPKRRIFQKNYQSCYIYQSKVTESINRYVAAGYLAGPYKKEPFRDFVSNALAAIPKAESEDIRLCADM